MYGQQDLERRVSDGYMNNESATEIATRIAIDATELEHQLQTTRDALEQAQERYRKLASALSYEKEGRTINVAERIEQLEAALKTYEGIVAVSNGVDGYHLNGDMAEWDDFDLPPIIG